MNGSCQNVIKRMKQSINFHDNYRMIIGFFGPFFFFLFLPQILHSHASANSMQLNYFTAKKNNNNLKNRRPPR